MQNDRINTIFLNSSISKFLIYEFWMNSTLEKSIQETPQDSINSTTVDDHIEIPNNHETHKEFFFSDSKN